MRSAPTSQRCLSSSGVVFGLVFFFAIKQTLLIVPFPFWARPNDLRVGVIFVPVGGREALAVDVERHGWHVSLVVDAMDVVRQQGADIAVGHHHLVEILEVGVAFLQTVILAQPSNIFLRSIDADDASPGLVIVR